MLCPECRGKGTVIYYRETDHDENSVTVTGYTGICCTCHGTGLKPMINAYNILAMSDEELREFICGSANCDNCAWSNGCSCTLPEWLKQLIKDGEIK